MIRKVKYKDIDFAKYSACIENSAQRNFYAQKEILDQLSGNWEILVLNDYEAVMPVHLKNKFGINFVHMPLFCQQLGIFSEKDEAERNEIFLSFLRKKYRVYTYNFNSGNSFTNVYERRKNYIITKNTYGLQRKKYFKGRKSTVKSAQNQSFKCVEFSPEIISFISKNQKGLEKRSDLRFYRDYLFFLDQRGYLKIFAAEKPGTISSVALIVHTKDEISLLALVNNNQRKDANGASFLIDRILQENIEQKNFNFMGSSIRGIEIFFKSFGAENHDFVTVQNSGKNLLKMLF